MLGVVFLCVAKFFGAAQNIAEEKIFSQFDIDAIDKNLPFRMMIKTRDQVGKR